MLVLMIRYIPFLFGQSVSERNFLSGLQPLVLKKQGIKAELSSYIFKQFNDSSRISAHSGKIGNVAGNDASCGN